MLSLVSFYFVFISFRFVSFLLISFRFVSFRFVFVDFVSFRFVSFLFRFALYRYPSNSYQFFNIVINKVPNFHYQIYMEHDFIYFLNSEDSVNK